MTSPIPLHVWLSQMSDEVESGTVIEASDDDARPVTCTKLEGGAWRIVPRKVENDER